MFSIPHYTSSAPEKKGRGSGKIGKNGGFSPAKNRAERCCLQDLPKMGAKWTG
jgi:hypothetical protein